MSSPFCGEALPAPGPATVQLALIRSAIELYGLPVSRDRLFPHIVACKPLIQPPDVVSITSQLQRVYKADDSSRLIEGIGYREYCHCEGCIRVFLCLPSALAEEFTALFHMIGYWGRSDSLAFCIGVDRVQPELGQFAKRLNELPEKARVQNYFSAYANELVSPDLPWTDIVLSDSTAAKSPVRPHLYVWPLVNSYQGTAQVLRFCSLER
jgi:hypothetical protein